MRFRIQYLMTSQCLAAAVLALLLCTRASAIDEPYPGPFIENDQLLIVLMPHTPEQMAAFYEARGFPRDAINLIRQTCFVTVHIENKSRSTLWLEQKNLLTSSNGKPLEIAELIGYNMAVDGAQRMAVIRALVDKYQL